MATKRSPKHEKKELPLGKSTFPVLLEDNCIYVDKTRYIYPLVRKGGPYFLSRPRRFGKSLTVSVLKEIFLGHRDLFKGYWIYDQIDWKKYPVIHLDFMNIDFRALGLEKAIDNELERISQDYGIPCSGDSISEKFTFLIGKLAQDLRIVVLVDEYDKPVTEYIEDLDTAVKNRGILRNFYSVLKGKEEKIEFLFMTGISRFTRLSIFSDLNHLTDISFHKDYTILLGYTGEEIEKYFDDYIHEWLRLHKGSTKAELLEKLKDYYNGYSWNGKDFVYNPYSINNFFDNMEFKNYWFASGTTTSLVKLVKKKNIAVENWEYLEVQEQFFDKFDIADININLMLFQTGYLTVKKRIDDTYVLSYPNREVEYALLNNLMEVYSGHSPEDTERLIKEIKESLEKKQMDPFIHRMKAFIASIPYNLVEAGAERFYHLVFYLVLKLLIGKVSPEKYTHLGRIDTAVETGSFIYVIEFKMGSAAEAVKQILEKKYYEPYLAQPQKIILLGIGFSVKDRNISGYKSIEVDRNSLPMEIDKLLAEETGTSGPAAIPPVERAAANPPVTGKDRSGQEKEPVPPGKAWPDKYRMKRVFIIYSQQDEKWKDRLVKQLEVLELQGELETWDAQGIAAGDDWPAGITGALNEAEVAVLVISADFLTSGFIRKPGVPELLQRRAGENMKIFSLIARPCPWSHVPWLSTFQALPNDGKTLSEIPKPKREKILTNFALEIKNILLTSPGKNKKI